MNIVFSEKELSNEIWKDVVGYEGLYQVSNLGRVKSLRIYIENRGGSFRERGERILKNCSDKDGYKLVGLSKDKVRMSKRVHRLVAEAFLPNPNNLLTINHKNTVKYDNRVENLEWDSYRDNNIKKHNKNKTSSKLTGVCFKKQNNNWTAHISLNGKQSHLGSFNKEEYANIMYTEAYNNIDVFDGDLLKFRKFLLDIIFNKFPEFSIIKRKNKNNIDII
jgi:hypothetical protein